MLFQRTSAALAQMATAGLLALAVVAATGKGSAAGASDAKMTPALQAGQAVTGGAMELPSASVAVGDPQLMLDGEHDRDMLMIRLYPRRLKAAEKARWQHGLQGIMERLDDDGSANWQFLANYRYLLANYLKKRRCRTESYVRLRSRWDQMVSMHDMLLATVGEDAVRAVVAAAAADADARPCG